MHEHLQIPRDKILGRLETRDGILIAVGGAEFTEDASGFFITAPGCDMVPILPGQTAQISSEFADVISVWDLMVAAATASLPRRYTFRYGAVNEAAAGEIEQTFTTRRKSLRPASARSKAPQHAPSMAFFEVTKPGQLKSGQVS